MQQKTSVVRWISLFFLLAALVPSKSVASDISFSRSPITGLQFNGELDAIPDKTLNHNGLGKFSIANMTVVGTFVNGKQHGYGGYIVHGTDGGAGQVGNYVNGELHGWGEFIAPNGRYNSGNYYKGKLHGIGSSVWPDGSQYVGDFVNGERSGKGTYTWPDGSQYVGDFANGQRSGKGTLTWPDGSQYVGDFVDGKRTGKGINALANGTKYDGNFLDGKLHGFAVKYAANGAVISHGMYENNKRIDLNSGGLGKPDPAPQNSYASSDVFSQGFQNHHAQRALGERTLEEDTRTPTDNDALVSLLGVGAALVAGASGDQDAARALLEGAKKVRGSGASRTAIPHSTSRTKHHESCDNISVIHKGRTQHPKSCIGMQLVKKKRTPYGMKHTYEFTNNCSEISISLDYFDAKGVRNTASPSFGKPNRWWCYVDGGDTGKFSHCPFHSPTLRNCRIKK